MKRTKILRKAIMERRAVAVPGCHDALSAKVIEKCGFEAIQVSGYGLAGSFLGKPDVGLVRMKDVLDLTWNIAQAVSIPVMADLDTGGGNAVNAAWITERLIAMGVAGMNIEDQVFPKRCGHMAGKEVIGAEEMAGKVRACAEVRDRLDRDFIINARTDVSPAGPRRGDQALQHLSRSRGRSRLHRRHQDQEGHRKRGQGGQGPALREPDGRDQRGQDRARPAPRAGEAGRRPRLHPGRVDHGRAQGAEGLLHRAQGLADRLLPGQTQWVTSFEEYTDFVGLKEYRAMENEYLPASGSRPSTKARKRSSGNIGRDRGIPWGHRLGLCPFCFGVPALRGRPRLLLRFVCPFWHVDQSRRRLLCGAEADR